MGAWGHGSFDNDSAMDWVADLESSDDTSVLAETFDAIPRDADEYVEVDEASAAIAAGEVVAALAGRALITTLPESVQEWLVGKPAPKPGLVKKAIRAVKRVRIQSEAQELWEETGLYDAWRGVVDDLLARLQSALPAE